jgi:hypothetical protein
MKSSEHPWGNFRNQETVQIEVHHAAGLRATAAGIFRSQISECLSGRLQSEQSRVIDKPSGSTAPSLVRPHATVNTIVAPVASSIGEPFASSRTAHTVGHTHGRAAATSFAVTCPCLPPKCSIVKSQI